MATNLRIGKYEVEWDGNAWCVSRVSVVGVSPRGIQPKPENIGKRKVRPVGWYATLDQALRRVLDEKLGDSEAQDVSAMLAAIKAAAGEIAAAVGQERAA